jgi:hypothetical protein
VVTVSIGEDMQEAQQMP